MQTIENDFFKAAYNGDFDTLKAALDAGQTINAVEATTGLTAFHMAVGRDHLDIAKYLVARGAACLPDQSGRWPSTIACLCEVSGEMIDFVCDEEVKWDVAPPRPAPG